MLFHEFGHFLVARLNGVAVEEFSLGYGPRLLSFVKGGTRYSLKILLFGGSCRMKGMLPEWTEDGSISDTPPEEGSFLAASPGRRAAIVFAGPLFNFILAFLGALIVISVVGYDPALVTHVTEDSHAYEAGLRQGDLVTSFMGHRVSIGRDIDTWFLFDDLQEGQPVTVTYERDGQKQSISYIPDSVRRYMLGLTYNADDSEAVINAVSVKSPLESAGVRAGDVITAVNGEPVATGEALFQYFADHPMDGSAVNLSLSRGGRAWETEVTPVYTDDVRLGFAYNLGRVRTTPVRTVLYGLIEVRYWIVSTVKSVGSLFTGRFSVNDLSGPVGVADVVGTTYEQAKKEGIRPCIYTHPLGFHGHAAGPTIGLWDHQEGVEGSGDYPLHDNTAYSLELNATVYSKTYGCDIRMAMESDILLKDGKVYFLAGRQENFHVVK